MDICFNFTRSGVAGFHGRCMLNFLRHFFFYHKMYSKMVVMFYIQPTSEWESELLHILTNTCFCQSFKLFSSYWLFFSNVLAIVYGILSLRTSKYYSVRSSQSTVVYFIMNSPEFYLISLGCMYIWQIEMISWLHWIEHYCK